MKGGEITEYYIYQTLSFNNKNISNYDYELCFINVNRFDGQIFLKF